MHILKDLRLRAADDESGSGPVEEPSRTKIADRLWIGADRKEVDTPEEAAGVLYKFLGRTKDGITVPPDSQAFTRLFSEMSEAELKMLAGFGAHTLMGNVTNTWLGEKGDKAATAHDAIKERFDLLYGGTWVDRTGTGVGARIDKDALAEAVCRVMVAKGTWTQADVDGGRKAAVRQKMEDDPQSVKASRQVPEIASEYAAIVGRATKSAEDVAALFA